MKRYHIMTIAILLLVVLLGGVTRAALAHEHVDIGPYSVVIGWQVEPPIVGERNAITIRVTQDEEPVVGVEATLDVEVLYGGRAFRANLDPTSTPGLYEAEIFPTVQGQYEVRLFGDIGETAVDETVQPEEVFPASRLQFPEPEPEARQLKVDIDVLASQLRTARTVAVAGVVLGILGIALGAVGFVRGRSS